MFYEFKFHFRPANVDRLYLNRDKNGRNLKLIEHKFESILFNFNNYLNKNKDIDLRKMNILKYEEGIRNNILKNIEDHVTNKYYFSDDLIINKQQLVKTQQQFLLNNINEKLMANYI